MTHVIFVTYTTDSCNTKLKTLIIGKTVVITRSRSNIGFQNSHITYKETINVQDHTQNKFSFLV
jgi:hypothetical protein